MCTYIQCYVYCFHLYFPMHFTTAVHKFFLLTAHCICFFVFILRFEPLPALHYFGWDFIRMKLIRKYYVYMYGSVCLFVDFRRLFPSSTIFPQINVRFELMALLIFLSLAARNTSSSNLLSNFLFL